MPSLQPCFNKQFHLSLLAEAQASCSASEKAFGEAKTGQASKDSPWL